MKAKLLGGSPQELIKQQVKDRYEDIKKHAPVTLYQIGLGMVVYPFQRYLKYSRGINHTLFTGFFCYGSGFEMIKRVYGLYTYQQPLERQYSNFTTLLLLKMGLSIGSCILFRTDLYSVLEHSVRWTWAFTTDSKPYNLNGYLSIPPPMLPLVLSFMESSFQDCLVGLGISLVSCYLLDLQRGDKKVVEYAYNTYEYYYSLAATLLS